MMMTPLWGSEMLNTLATLIGNFHFFLSNRTPVFFFFSNLPLCSHDGGGGQWTLSYPEEVNYN